MDNMNKKTKDAYKLVLKDLKSQFREPCKDRSPICCECITRKITEDLEYMYEMFKDIN